jgi:hypothetical protein
MVDILAALKSELSRLTQQIETVKSAIAVYGGKAGGKKQKGTMSASARKKIAAAQRKRWAAKRKADKEKAKS